MSTVPSTFADQVVTWQRRHGRHDLPWQNTRDPYRVWLSEIMLQQTQVSTVLDYFPRFLSRFPTVAALAAGDSDEVFGLWSGLGYYSRARNLHACAKDVVALHAGVFPRAAEVLQTLPGIGRSTAAAIASLCFEERVAILDGNVRRVLTRVLGFDVDLSLSVNEKALWVHANRLVPLLPQDMPAYTQGVMDLGATLCVRRKPLCATCPLVLSCEAKREGRPEHYPVKTRKLKRSAEAIWLLQAYNEQGDVWLAQRPEKGVWAKLYCLPAFESSEALTLTLPEGVVDQATASPAFIHVLTHKDLHLHPMLLRVESTAWPQRDGRWVSPSDWPQLGLPAPVRKLLEQMSSPSLFGL